MDYWTVCIRDESDGQWYDETGFTSAMEARKEANWLRDDGKKVKIVLTDGTAAGLIAALAQLNG